MQTNWDEECVNLTLELTQDELEINVVGWKEPQANAFAVWLAPSGVIRSIDAPLELVVYRRLPANLAAKGTAKKPWYQRATSVQAARDPIRDLAGRRLDDHLAACRNDSDPAWEKLAFHLRGAWPAQAVVARADAIVDAVVPMVVKLAHVARSART